MRLVLGEEEKKATCDWSSDEGLASTWPHVRTLEPDFLSLFPGGWWGWAFSMPELSVDTLLKLRSSGKSLGILQLTFSGSPPKKDGAQPLEVKECRCQGKAPRISMQGQLAFGKSSKKSLPFQPQPSCCQTSLPSFFPHWTATFSSKIESYVMFPPA